MQTEPGRNIPDDEIDLRSLGARLYAFITYPFSLLFSNLLITACFLLAAVLLPVVAKYTLPKVYTSSFIIRPTDLRDKIYLKVLSEIPALHKRQDKKALRQLLQVDSATVASLEGIKLLLPAGSKNNTDSTGTVEIELKSSGTKHFLPLQNGILNYLENNPYYQKIKNLQKEQIALNMQQIDKDLQQLDSLKNLQLALYEKQQVQAQSAVLLNELVDPVAAYTASSERMTKKTNLMAQTVFIDRFLLVKSCVEPTRPTWPPRILVMCLYTVPFFLVLCAFFLHYRRKRS